jgi:diguanylate cyclase (GGDEF)-like protein
VPSGLHPFGLWWLLEVVFFRATISSVTQASDADPVSRGATGETRADGPERDVTAEARDRVAEARDTASERRDEQADARDRRAGARRPAAGVDHAAAADRAGAHNDREGSAADRTHASHDRQASSVDREMSAQERQLFLVDGLTGARRRDAGLLELEREITRADRTGQTFVLVFVDVDGLKRINDVHGHTAGDELLAHIAETIRSHLRAYDLIVRYGGDEFLCGLMDLSLHDTVERFAHINTSLISEHRASVTAGVTELRAGDRLQDLIERADAALYDERQHTRGQPT